MSARRIRRAHQRRVGRAAAAAVGGSALLASGAQAANFPVSNLNDSGAGSLRGAIMGANGAGGADTISFTGAATSGEIRLTTGNLAIYDDLTINGPGPQLSISGDANNNDVVDFATADAAQGDHRIFNINDPSSPGTPVQQVSISGLTLKEGVADLWNSGSGGAVSQGGGAIYSRGTALTVSNVTFTGNVATGSGGAIDVVENGDAGRLTVTGSSFSGNRARDTGGAISTQSNKYDVNEPEVGTTIANSQISGNRAGGTNFGGFGFTSSPSGGGISTKYDANLSGATITGNTASTTNGGFTAGDGGGVRISGGGAVTDSVIADNYAGERGGGADIQGVRVRSTTVSGNSAGEQGGGLLAVGKYDVGPTRIDNSTISGNSALGTGPLDGYGGGMVAYANGDTESVIVRNSTIAANSAADRGGGIATDNYGDSATTVRLKSSIVGDNAAAGAPNDLYGSFFNGTDEVPDNDSIDAGFSLIEAPGAQVLAGDPTGSNLIGVDPQLAPLADNGGPGRTQAPALTSPAVDAAQANGFATDQRGQARTVDAAATNAPLSDGTDMGALELTDPKASGDDPETKITKKPKKKLKLKGGKKTVKVKLKFKGTDNAPPPGPMTFECKIDKGPFEDCKSPLKLELDKGKHKFQVRAIDADGNVDSTPAKAKTKVK